MTNSKILVSSPLINSCCLLFVVVVFKKSLNRLDFFHYLVLGSFLNNNKNNEKYNIILNVKKD